VFVYPEDIDFTIVHHKSLHAFKNGLAVVQAHRQRAQSQVVKGDYLCILPFAPGIFGYKHMFGGYLSEGEGLGVSDFSFGLRGN
jgi:hypothetical protein